MQRLKREAHAVVLLVTTAAAALALLPVSASADVKPDNAVAAAATDMVMMAVAVPSSDLERSVDFYTRGLGMTRAGTVEMGNVTEVPLAMPGGGTYIMLLKPKDEPAQLPARGALSRIILQVPDLKALEAQLKAAGYALTRSVDLPQHKVSVGLLEDPDGNHIELVQRHTEK